MSEDRGCLVVRWCSTLCKFSSETRKHGDCSSGKLLRMEARSLSSLLTWWMPHSVSILPVGGCVHLPLLPGDSASMPGGGH